MTTTQADQGRIVVGVDGSPHSAAALRWALRQAALTGGHVDAVACWHRPALVGGYTPADYSDMPDIVGDNARAMIAATPGAAHASVAARVVEGHPGRVLVEAAVGADLLVVGSRGHSELTGMALGSVGLHCASHAPCPVLIVHDHTHLPGT